MIYFVEGSLHDERLKWCRDNNIRYIRGHFIAFPFIVFTLGFFTEKKLNQIISTLILFDKEEAMAFKLRWC